MAAQSPDPETQPSPQEPDLDIETPGVWCPPLEELPDLHRQRNAYALCACGRPGNQPKIYVHTEALEKIISHVCSDLQHEVGGVLVGDFFTCAGRHVTDIRTVIPALQTRAGVTHVTFSHETWAAINAQMDSSPTEYRIVGWYHSHPNFGVFLSSQDVFTHENFFDYEGHVALVFDPHRHQIGAFTKREGRVVPTPGFWIAAPRDNTEGPKRYARMLHYSVGDQRRGPLAWFRRLLLR